MDCAGHVTQQTGFYPMARQKDSILEDTMIEDI